MRGLKWISLTLCVAALLGCSPQESPKAGPTTDLVKVRANLEKVAQARILFGHKSVGRNVLAGLASLAAELDVPLRIVAIQGLPPDDAPGLFHSEIGDNGDPQGKCKVFDALLNRPEQPAYDVAMMKFCYTDLTASSPVSAAELLEQYAGLMSQIAADHPDVRIVYVTLPLRADPPGRKTFVMRLLGLSVEGDADNVVRNDFNDLLRKRFAGQPVFDLAAIESTHRDGSRSSFSRSGRRVYTLANEYTDDGGHLNASGRRQAAIAFVNAVVAALR